MTDDICGATKRDGTDDACQLPAGWGTDHTGEGRCKLHGGAEDAGAPEGNQNATRHGIHATPEYLADHLNESQRDQLVATFEALCTRYERRRGHDPDYAAKRRLRRVSIEILKEDLADEWLASEAADSGSLLMERREMDDGETYAVPNAVLEPLTALKRETRLTLKDMGLLDDPDTQQADALEGLSDGAELVFNEADEAPDA
jgi:hypothetical protein